jgi:hypothetical protein
MPSPSSSTGMTIESFDMEHRSRLHAAFLQRSPHDGMPAQARQR